LSGIIDPSPACARAIEEVATSLRANGHEVVDVYPPSPFEALVLSSQLINSDGCKTFKSLIRKDEWLDPGPGRLAWYMGLHRPLRYLHHLWIKYVRGDTIYAELLYGMHEKKCVDQWKLVAKREAYKARWHNWWSVEAQIDALLTAPFALPAIPHGSMDDMMSSCGYAVMFNLVS